MSDGGSDQTKNIHLSETRSHAGTGSTDEILYGPTTEGLSRPSCNRERLGERFTMVTEVNRINNTPISLMFKKPHKHLQLKSLTRALPGLFLV